MPNVAGVVRVNRKTRIDWSNVPQNQMASMIARFMVARHGEIVARGVQIRGKSCHAARRVTPESGRI
jgi:hypothetical protein